MFKTNCIALILGFALFPFSLSAQKKLQFIGGASISYDNQTHTGTAFFFPVIYTVPNESFVEYNLKAGTKFSIGKGDLHTFVKLQNYANLSWRGIGAYKFQSFLLGAGAEYHFRKDNRWRPFLGVSFLTELFSNYKNKSFKYFFPVKFPEKASVNLHSIFYVSTPFLGSVWAGYDFRIIDQLHVQLSLQNNFRVFKIKGVDDELEINPNVSEYLQNAPIQHRLIDALMLKLGVTYHF